MPNKADSKMKMKIFEIVYNDGEQQWIAAHTNIEALQEVLSMECTDIDLMAEIKELPENKWDELNVINAEDFERMTFREFTNTCDGPQIISATFYND